MLVVLWLVAVACGSGDPVAGGASDLAVDAAPPVAGRGGASPVAPSDAAVGIVATAAGDAGRAADAPGGLDAGAGPIDAASDAEGRVTLDAASPADASIADAAAAGDAGLQDAAPREPLPACEDLYGRCPATAFGVECPAEALDEPADAPHCRCASGTFCLCEASACTRYVSIGAAPMIAEQSSHNAWRCYTADEPLAVCASFTASRCGVAGEACIGKPPDMPPSGLGLGSYTLCFGQRALECGEDGRWAPPE